MYTNNNLKIESYKDAYIFPFDRGVYNSVGEFILNTSKRKLGVSEWAIGNPLTETECNTAEYRNESVIYIGFVRMHYGHFLIDCCSRMWALTDMNLTPDIKICFISYENDIAKFVIEYFEGLGINPERLVHVDCPVKYREILIPDIAFYPMISMNNTYWIKSFNTIISRCMTNVQIEDASSDLLYLSQSKYKVGRRYGEALIEKLFNNNGYKIVYPEKLSLKEQVYLYNNAKIVVCTNGTLAHNGIWMKENAKLVVLDRFIDNDKNPHQEYINNIRKLDYIELVSCWKGSKHDLCCMRITSELRNWCIEEKMNSRVHVWGYPVEIMKFLVFSVYMNIKNLLMRIYI